MKPMKLDVCSSCKETETYRKCSECNSKPLCIICESKHKHQTVVILEKEVSK